MSILDTPREYKKPTEEVARVLSDMLAVRMSFAEPLAAAVLTRLDALGFISPLGQDALKAEAAADRGQK